MDAMGWQIGAVLIGISSLIIAIYLAKLLHSATTVVEKATRIIDYNERYINETIENIASITDSAEDIIEMISRVTSITKLFRIRKR